MDTREKPLSSGLEGNAADYATFLQKIMDGTYVVGDYLNYDPCRPIRVTFTSIAVDSETRALQAMQCDVGQGYLIAKPMPHQQLMEWCRTSRPLPSLQNDAVLRVATNRGARS